MSAPDRTYWDIVRAQFKKNGNAVAGLYVIAGLFLVAIIAPVLATSSPFYLSTAKGVEFPWFRDLLDQNRFPSGVDIFFNLLLIALPFVAVAWFVFRGKRKKVLKWSTLVVLYLFASVSSPAKILDSGIGKIVFFPQHVLRYQKPKRSYLDERLYLEQLVAEQRVATFEKKDQTTTAELDAAREEMNRVATQDGITEDDRANANAKLAAAQADREAARRNLKKWQGQLEAIVATLAEEENKYTALMPPIGYHHDDNDEERIVEGPTFTGWGIGHFLGTDRNGRDVLARILYGTRVSLTIGVIAVSIYCFIGVILGSLAGYFRGWVDVVIMRAVEIMICFPTFAFVLILVAVTGSKNIFMIMVAIGLIQWTGVTRLIRGQFMVERNLDYVFAARALGIPNRRIVFRHVLPNAIHPVFVSATFGVAAAILMESGLAFLGLGDPLVPSWGQLLLQGRQTGKLWLILSPGVAIFLTVTVLNLVGEGLRDALDPKLRQ